MAATTPGGRLVYGLGGGLVVVVYGWNTSLTVTVLGCPCSAPKVRSACAKVQMCSSQGPPAYSPAPGTSQEYLASASQGPPAYSRAPGVPS